MQNIKRQGGSVAVFVVVGVVLVAAALGTAYGVKHMVMRDQTPPMTLPGLFSSEDEPSDRPEQEADQAPDNQPSGSNEQPDESSPSPASNEQGQIADSGQQNTQNSPPSGLPQSGPAETLSSVVAIAAVTASLTAYVRSLRRF